MAVGRCHRDCTDDDLISLPLVSAKDETRATRTARNSEATKVVSDEEELEVLRHSGRANQARENHV